jgi:metallo-beta-lactamase class B
MQASDSQALKTMARLVSVLMAGALAVPAVAGESPDALSHAQAAAKIAGADLTGPLFLCQPHAGGVIREALVNGSKRWIEPTRLFDNLYFVGTEFVGVLAFQTKDGLILFDAGQSEAEARDHIVPGLVKLGLDPKTIRYVVVTHGHRDHFGGAEYLQRTYGAHVAMGKADWDLALKASPGAPDPSAPPPPRRDIEVVDGQTLTLGGETLKFTLSPGHTFAAVSTIIPAREGGKVYPISLLGSEAFPSQLQPDERSAGLLAYDRSILRFAQVSADAKAQGLFNTHVFADGYPAKLAAARARKPGDPNPFVKGPAYVGRYYEIVHHCLLAAETRTPEENAWNVPAQP